MDFIKVAVLYINKSPLEAKFENLIRTFKKQKSSDLKINNTKILI